MTGARTTGRSTLGAELDRIEVATLRRAGGLTWSLYPDPTGTFVAESDFGTAPGGDRGHSLTAAGWR